MTYLIFDRETENHEFKNRFASPFSKKNWTVALGWKKEGDSCNSYKYFPTPEHEKPLQIDPDVTLLVGHNIKFDLLYGWRDPGLLAFFKRGGKVWDTQYVEYLLHGMQQKYHMIAMDDIVEKYGGRKKIDAVKALWEEGYLTSEIDKDLLIDYLIGTEEENRCSGDIGNTELIFKGQYKKAVEKGMLAMIEARMDGLLCTTEMEYNGLKIDINEAARRMEIMEHELEETDKKLIEYIPELPSGFVFNWSSNQHKSALIFGGAIPFKRTDRYIDEETGKYARKKVKAQWPLFGGVPKDPAMLKLLPTGFYQELESWRLQDEYSSGKKKGSPKFKTVEVLGDFKVKAQTFIFNFPGYTKPDARWKTNLKDANGNPVYQTNDDVISELGARDVPFLKLMSKRATLLKDLGTYYMRYDEKSKKYKGMLTAVRAHTHIVNHSLHHVTTVTSRLSSSNPNLQNTPRADTSEVKKMFISRFDGGLMLEVDYSQLEVVIQGMLSRDKNLCEDLKNKIDFHCKRVAAKYKVPYETALYRCKDSSYPEYAVWKKYRTECKEFSFQRAYGAGAPAISASTGMSIDDVKALIKIEDEMYPGVKAYNDKVAEEVERSCKPFKDYGRGGKLYRRGFYQAPTGTLYCFRSYDAPKFLQEQGVRDTFKPTEMKNYPIQGTGGEVVQIVLGKLWRHFISNDNYGGKALLCNTVHDCVWFDFHPSVQEDLCKDVKYIMESVPRYLNELYGMKVTVPFPVELEIGNNLYDKKVIHI